MRRQNSNRVAVLSFVIASVALLAPSASGAKGQGAARSGPTPTAADYAYGKDSERQKFDFWQAKSDKPTPLVLLIHGGGWMGGDKTGYGTGAIQPFLDAGHLGRVDQLSLHPPGDGAEGRAAGEGLPARRGAGTANDSLESQGVEPRSQARRRDGRIGRRLHLAVAGAARRPGRSQAAATRSPASRRG